MEQKKWINYWKKSLSDSMKANIDIGSLENFEIADFRINEPAVGEIQKVNALIDHEEIRINKKRGVTNKDNENWTRLKQITVLIAPIKIVPVPERLVYFKDKSPKFPFWYYAVIDRQGNLTTPEEFFPVFQRRFLEPLADESTEFVFSSVEKVDKAISIGKESYQNFNEYINYVKEVFEIVVEQNLESFQVADYITVKNGIVLVPDEDINAASGIIYLYEKILRHKTLPKLLANFIDTTSPAEQPPIAVPQLIESNYLHVGQMGADFPLSISQRKSLYTILKTQSLVFAVNGPPGTGKTTLLQSIVANKIVESALKGEGPPIILACSTNNQAVTNIIDSFSKSSQKKTDAQIRWLPDITGYATYLPGNNKPQTELDGINYKKLSGDGLFTKIENHDYLQAAKDHYLEKGAEHFETSTLSVRDIIDRLQDQIKEIQISLQEASNNWRKYLEIEKTFLNIYLPEGSDRLIYYRREMLNEEVFDADIVNLSGLEATVIQYFKNESFLRKIFCFLGLKSALRNRAAELRIILRNSLIERSGNTDFTKAGIFDRINDMIKTAQQIIKGISQWKNWKKQYAINGNPPQSEEEYRQLESIKIDAVKKKVAAQSKPNCFYDELDVTLRHRSFQLAINYWEGRWLLALENDLLNPNFNRKSESEMMNRWTRQAMITPCFVSTFFMAPKFFSAYKFLQTDDTGKNIFDNPPLFEFIDLLIVDEAGQVSPEVGIATFALARQAVIAGDIKQIEPVWNVTKKIDIGNLKREGLIENYKDLIYEKMYDPKGFLASTGSIMKMAQNVCPYKEPGAVERGLLLVEHRRCYDEIINYCNVLAYNGQLRPLKGKADKSNPFPPMYCFHVKGHSRVINNSRDNEMEVDAIIQWVLSNKAVIESTYGKVELAVGVITPFTGQKNRLKDKFKKGGFNTELMKIGTVHALQGAERSIILFSMVYGPGDSGSMFFDRDNKPNMLNVAVSRAKDSFIVFANTEIFNKNARTPSGILSNHLLIHK
jgi:superfamily I DNA and/or RNA helicase